MSSNHDRTGCLTIVIALALVGLFAAFVTWYTAGPPVP